MAASNPSIPSNREKEIFEQALDLPTPAERRAFIEAACGGDATLRARLHGLLLAHDQAEGFLPGEPVAAGVLTAVAAAASALASGEMPVAAVTEMPGDRIGRYKLLEQIGEGGCGVVFMAEQEEPVLRKVALKLVKPGMDTKSVIARFEAERQALAMMDHPNIARVFDGGVTGGGPLGAPASSRLAEPAGRMPALPGDDHPSSDPGRPYFVMELVRGVRITEDRQEHKLGTRERLDLFTAVCSAVQHAHQKGIIHRDLKPSNILVTEIDGKPVPKVIDFGIAKATEQKLTDKTLFTQFAQFIGTPAYMSPEQAAMSGADIDTRSDIYSLGVLLYELLTGTTPFDAKELLEAGFDEMRRIIRETEPPKPSTRLTQSEGRGQRTEGRGRRSEVGGRRSEISDRKSALPTDLDWIVMKCLEKDRGRRYETASGLAADIQRHLSSEPVTARPASAAYRFRKMVRRNKLAFSAAGAVAAALVIGLSVSTWMFFKEKHAREKERQALVRAVAAEQEQSRLRQAAEEQETKATAEAARSTQVAQFLEDMLKGVGPSVALGRDTTLLREILEKTAERIGTDLKDQPEVEAALRETLGRVYFALGDLAKSETMHRAALERLRTLRTGDDPVVAISLSNLANALRDEFKLDEAEPLFREALAMQKRLFGDEHAEVATTLNNLALVLYDQSKLPEAETMFREALSLHRKLLGNEHKNVTATLGNLALVLEELGKPADAEALHREGLALKRKLYTGDHPEVATGLRNLASALDAQGKHGEALEAYREALAMMRKVHPDGHPHVSAVLNALGLLLSSQGRHDEGEVLIREALDWAREAKSATLPVTLSHLGLVMERQEKFAAAEPFFREALETGRALKHQPSYVAAWCMRLAFVLEKQGKPADAEPLRREVLEFVRAQPRPDPQKVALRLLDLEENLFLQGKYADAESLLIPGSEALQNDQKIEAKFKRNFLTRLVRLYKSWSKTDKAAEWQQKLDAFEKADSAPDGAPKPNHTNDNTNEK